MDRALETPIELGAEGASVTTPNSQAKGQRFFSFVFLTDRVVLVRSVCFLF